MNTDNGYIYDEKYNNMTEEQLWWEAHDDGLEMDEPEWLEKWGKFMRDYYLKKHGKENK